MILGTCLNGFAAVELLQHHDPRQMVGEGHGAHGELEVGLFFDPGGHAEGRTDEEAGAGLAGQLDLRQFLGKFLTGQLLALRGEDTEPGALGDFCENGLRFLLQARRDLGRGGILRQADLRELQQVELTLAAQTLLVLVGGGDIEFFLQLAHGDEGDFEHGAPPIFFIIIP